MNPEERQLLERSLKLSEDNNRMLKKIERRARLAFVWGFVKVLIIVIPLVASYIFLEPYFNQVKNNYDDFKNTLNLLG